MKVYIHDEKTGGKVVDLCKASGVELLTVDEVRRRKSMPAGYSFFLDQVDVLILEVTKPTQDIHFILAQAILAEKPALCLYGKNQPPRELLRYIKQKHTPRPIKTFSYTEASLSTAVHHFLQRNDPVYQQQADAPSIKFTLRLTRRIEHYLDWMSKRKRATKADFIREILSDLAKNDRSFKRSQGEEDGEEE